MPATTSASPKAGFIRRKKITTLRKKKTLQRLHPNAQKNGKGPLLGEQQEEEDDRAISTAKDLLVASATRKK
jgi:hypothetical protein